MAVKGKAEITLTFVKDIQAYYRYYLLQSSTSAKPSKPTAYPPSSSWDDTEPTYTSGSTNSLYFVDCTVFCDGTFSYSDVSLSSSYEAAKEAFNKSVAAANAANAAQEALDVATDVIIGTQTAVTGAWTGIAKFSELKDGQQIVYWLPYAGSGNATLNLTLSDGTTTGAIACYYSGTTRLTTHYAAGNAIRLVYRKDAVISGSSTKYTGWWADANYDSNNYDRVRYNAAIKCGSTAIAADNIIVGTSNGYQHLKSGSAFDISYPILYAGSAISASSTGTNNYLTMYITITTTQSITLTAYKPVYIKGKLSSTTFTPISTAPLTQTVPTSADGYHYILLGTAYSSTAMYLLNEHPIFMYYNGAFKSFQQIAADAAVGIDNLEVGGRNLALRTANFTNASDYWSIGSLFTSSVDEDGFTVMSATMTGETSNRWNRIIPHKFIPVEDMHKGITVSFDFMCDDYDALDHGCICALQVYKSDGTRIGWLENRNVLSMAFLTSDRSATNGEWCRLTTKFTETDLMTHDGSSDYTVNDVAYTSVSFQLVKNGSIHFRKVKIEYGNTATDWTPAPEDQIQSTVEEFYQSSSSTSLSGGSWSTTTPTWSNGKYIWRRTLVTYFGGATEYTPSSTGVCITGNTGATGATGNGISAVTNYYLATSSSSGVTTSTSGWSTSVQTMTTTNKYLWNYEKITYTSGSTSTTTPCIIGVYGNTGATGKGISSTAITYQASSSGTTVPTGTWSSSIPSVSAGQYLWTRTIITYSDSSTSTSYSVGMMGATGSTGSTGKGVSSTAVTYQAGTSGTSAPTGTWSSSIPSVSAGQYLWTRTIVTYSDSSTSTSYSVGMMGATGATGKGITSITEYYLASSASSGVTTSTSGWSTSMQTTTTTNKYLWNYEKITYTDGSTSNSTVRIIGTHGATGSTGKGISSTAITYQASTSGTTIPTGTWSSSIPSVSAGQYLWTRTIITYSDSTTSTSYSVGMMGATGATGATGSAGKGIKSTAITYQAGASGTTVPTGTWSTSVPSASASTPYIWTKTVITYTDSTTSTSYSVGCTPEGIVVGGRNLLSDTKNMSEYALSSNVTLSEDPEGFTVASFAAVDTLAWNNVSTRPAIPFSSVRGKTVTFSVDVRSADYSSLNSDASRGLVTTFALCTDSSTTRTLYVSKTFYTTTLSDDWQRIIFTKTLTDDVFTSGSGTIDDNTRWYIQVYNYSLYQMEIRKPKLEIGNKATDWTPAPEDVSSEIVQVVTEESANIQTTTEAIILDALKSYTETSDFEAFRTTVNSQLSLMADNMTLMFDQKTEEIQNLNNDLNSKFNQITKYFTFDVNGLTIGQSDSPYKVIIDNDRYSMTVNGVEVMWIADGKVHTPEIEVTTAFTLFGYLIDQDSNGNVNCGYIGG